MRGRVLGLVVASAVALAALKELQGCGASHGSDATFTGNVSAVREAKAAPDPPRRRWLPGLDSVWSGKALAAPATSFAHLLVCASNGGTSPSLCTKVDPDNGDFAISIDVDGGDFSSGIIAFIDDTNENGTADPNEGLAFVNNDYKPVCANTVVVLNGVGIDFPTHVATAASVDKEPDTCPPRTPSPTPSSTATRRPSPTSVPATPTSPPATTRTPTVGGTPTATPTSVATATATTYPYGASLNRPPSTMLAFFTGLAVAGLLLPTRRNRT